MESITDKERRYINLCHSEFNVAWHLNEDDEVLMTNNNVAVVEFLGYDAGTLSSYEETDKIATSAQNVWFDSRNTLLYFILKQK